MIDDIQAPSYCNADLPPILQKWAEMEDSVIDVTIDSAAATAVKIKESGLYFKKYIPNLFNYATEIRRFNWEAYGKLYSELLKNNYELEVLNKEFYQYLQRAEIVPLDKDKRKQPKRSLHFYLNEFKEDSPALAVKNDDLEKLIYYSANSDIFTQRIKWRSYNQTFLDLAAFCASPKCFKYLLTNGNNATSNTFVYAIEGGNPEIIDLLRQANFQVDNMSIVPALQSHRMTLVKWIMENTLNDVCDECIMWSIYNYSTCFYFCEICRFPRSSFKDLTENCLDAALEIGSGGVILSILCSTKYVNPPSEERLKKILCYALECNDEALLARLKELGITP